MLFCKFVRRPSVYRICTLKSRDFLSSYVSRFGSDRCEKRLTGLSRFGLEAGPAWCSDLSCCLSRHALRWEVGAVGPSSRRWEPGFSSGWTGGGSRPSATDT